MVILTSNNNSNEVLKMRNLRAILDSFFYKKKVQLNSYCPILFQMVTISISFSHSYTLHDVTMYWTGCHKTCLKR